MNKIPEDGVSIDEACNILGVKRRQLYEDTRDLGMSPLPYFTVEWRPGRTAYVPRSWVDEISVFRTVRNNHKKVRLAVESCGDEEIRVALWRVYYDVKVDVPGWTPRAKKLKSLMTSAMNLFNDPMFMVATAKTFDTEDLGENVKVRLCLDDNG